MTVSVPKRACTCAAISVVALVGVIVTIALIAESFANVDEGQACIQYSNYSGVLEETVVTTPENSFVGPHSGFACYPTLIQEMEFDNSGSGFNTILGTRTREGLFINVAVHLEYRIEPALMKDLFLTFGRWHNVVTNLTIIARSELRNTASRYGGLDYLAGDRALIAANMKTDLHEAFQKFHVAVSEVNIKSISLSSQFEDAFEAVREVKLAASKALQTREVDITQESRANQSAVITLLANRESTLLAARAEVTTAALERDAQVTEKDTAIITAKLKATSSRQTQLTQARSEVNKAKAERTARLTEAQVRTSEQTLQAQRSRGVVLIEAAAEVEKAKTALVAETTRAETEFAKQRVQLAQQRETALTAAKAKLAAAQLARVEAVLLAQTAQDVATTRESAKRERAAVLADVSRLQGNTTANAISEAEAAKAASDRALRDARVTFLKELQAKTGLTATEVLRYLHLGAVAKSEDSTTMFVDYKKVPLVLEAASAAGTPSIAVTP